MAENPIIARSDETKINEAVCIDTKRIYDSCVSKDCLEELRVAFDEEAQTLIDNAVTVKARDCDIASVSIDAEEIPFNRGYYSVDIQCYFSLQFDTYSAAGATPQIAVGYATFEKKCILFGSEGNVKIFTAETENGEQDYTEALQYTNPIAKLQAVDPVILQSETCDAATCPVSVPTSFPPSILENLSNSTVALDGTQAVLVTLGLFSIVQMERDVQIMIPAYDFCVPDRECDCTTQSPCETFRGIEFPVEEFFPPDKEDGSCGCGGNA